MRSETVPNGTDVVNEPSINSTRILNTIAADQADVTYLLIDAELKQNSEFVYDGRSNNLLHDNSSGRTVPLTTIDKESGCGFFFVQETNKLRSGYTNFPRLHVRMRYFQHEFLEGGYSHKGWVTPLRWHQDIRVQTAHTNSKQMSTTRYDKLIVLELHYRTKASMCNALSFQDLADQNPIVKLKRRLQR